MIRNEINTSITCIYVCVYGHVTHVTAHEILHPTQCHSGTVYQCDVFELLLSATNKTQTKSISPEPVFNNVHRSSTVRNWRALDSVLQLTMNNYHNRCLIGVCIPLSILCGILFICVVVTGELVPIRLAFVYMCGEGMPFCNI